MSSWPNRTPPGQVAMRLLIDAGSMQERPGEEGVAHFLEHLAFRGTAKYPDGEVQRALEGIGLQMAADVNASTGPDTTTFIIDLPRNDQVSLDTGLSVMRELVTSMLIEPDKVDAERGVVLAEERSRAGPALEASKAFLQLQLGNHPYGRSPIGLRNIIETVTPATIRGFYDAFYRPERATLIIVGDVRIDQMTAAITGAFQDWRGRGEPGKDPKPITVKPASPDVAIITTAGATDTNLMLRWFEPYTERPHTKAERRRVLVEQLASGVIARRLPGLNEAAGKPAARIGNAGAAAIPEVWRGQIATTVGITDTFKALDVMVKAHRQAVEFGITQEELDEQLRLVIDATKREAERGRTGTSVAQVEIAADMVAADLPFVSLQQGYALLLEQAPTITLAEVNASLKTRFRDKPDLLYRGSTPPPGGEAALRARLQQSMDRACHGLRAGRREALALR
jgi:zinc protease